MQCTAFVDQYSEMLIDLITKDMTPDQVCQELGLCDAKIEDSLNAIEANNVIDDEKEEEVFKA